RQLVPLPTPREEVAQLKEQLQAVRLELNMAEAELAEEQAAVNAFRMHCRLKLDALVDELQVLAVKKQSLLTHLELLRQAEEYGVVYDEEEPFWQSEAFLADEEEEELLLPTDTPRDKAAEKRLYRELARRFHPDMAETAVEQAYMTSIMAAVNNAYEKRDTQALYDLAGELDPGDLRELESIKTVEIRRLRESILKAQRLRRKSRQRLKVLRQENTARLWRKAKALDEEDDNWWDSVRRDLETAVQRRNKTITSLQTQITNIETAIAAEKQNGRQ
ncbi:MAG: hypothetical protein IAF02_23830, partial [Anaerolineae bacterium]|nr:hypothetical protein [Anaerolineae bacterium]